MKSLGQKKVIILLTGIFLFVSISAASDDIDDIKKAIAKKGARWTAGETWLMKLSPEERKRLCGTLLSKPVNNVPLLTIPILKDFPMD